MLWRVQITRHRGSRDLSAPSPFDTPDMVRWSSGAVYESDGERISRGDINEPDVRDKDLKSGVGDEVRQAISNPGKSRVIRTLDSSWRRTYYLST